MAAKEKATGNVVMKLHVFAQWKMPSKGTDVLPGSKGTESETDVELPGVFGDEQTHKTVEYDLDTVLSKENESSLTIMLETETKPSLTVTSETGTGHRPSQLSPQMKRHAIGREPIKMMAWSPSR
jgi:hypothetical protein